MSESARSRNEVAGEPRERPCLSAEGVALLHAALEKEVGSRSSKSSAALKHAIRRIATDAKRRNWPPEWLLVAIKAAAYSLPALERVPRGPERDEIVAHLVAVSIDEYYAGSAFGADASVDIPTTVEAPTVDKGPR
jgi:hypothetical protein